MFARHTIKQHASTTRHYILKHNVKECFHTIEILVYYIFNLRDFMHATGFIDIRLSNMYHETLMIKLIIEVVGSNVKDGFNVAFIIYIYIS